MKTVEIGGRRLPTLKFYDGREPLADGREPPQGWLWTALLPAAEADYRILVEHYGENHSAETGRFVMACVPVADVDDVWNGRRTVDNTYAYDCEQGAIEAIDYWCRLLAERAHG